jgi:hypothetical protein
MINCNPCHAGLLLLLLLLLQGQRRWDCQLHKTCSA